MIREAIGKLADRQDLSREEASSVMRQIMSGEAADSQIAAFLIGLRSKGESADEIAGCAEAMREKAIRITSSRKNVVDTCGTGGDNAGTFNVSTAAAIIAAGAGVAIAKHGNKAVSSSCGSADVLGALGVRIDLTPENAARVLDDIGITFLFAPLLHGAMKYAAGVRKELGIRTIFNILGPLTNPAGAKRQVLGVYDAGIGERMATALSAIGSEHALVVHGDGGIDELSTLGSTRGWEVKNGTIVEHVFDAQRFGFSKPQRSQLAGGDSRVNAEMLRSILKGQTGAPSDIALYNAAAAIWMSGNVGSLKEGIELARTSLESGSAEKKLNQWIEATNT